MRYNVSPCLWILIYIFFVWPYKRFNCNEICNHPNVRNYENVIIENDTYRYSHHYEYSMRIQRHQSQPVPSDRFNIKINGIHTVYPQFTCNYHSKYIRKIMFYADDADDVYDFRGYYIGTMINYLVNYMDFDTAVLDEKKLLGVKRTFSINVDGSEVEATMTSLIHPNGKISFYYDKIPQEIEESKFQSKIVGSIRCEGGLQKFFEIPVPAKWIKSGTLVEFQAMGESCSQNYKSEICQNAKTSTTKCFCCEKKKKCIELNNQDTHGLKVDDCRVENINTGTAAENKKEK
uniref:Smp_201330 n=2 Tax=Schistosoma mansoni TaxID=6183 RepID=G4LV63_SCHMA